jgi:DNA repair exonuclease SbcCD ATPase subunit
VCGNQESGMDYSLSDAGMVRCANDHTMCERHINNGNIDKKPMVHDMILENIEYYKNCSYPPEEKEKEIRELTDNLTDLETMSEEEIEEMYESFDPDYSLSIEQCPVCTFQKLLPADLAKYLLKIHGLDIEDIKKNIVNTFDSYSDFKESL